MNVITAAEAGNITEGLQISEKPVPEITAHPGAAPEDSHIIPCADNEIKPTYYLPLDPDTELWDDLTLEIPGCTLYLVSDTYPNKKASLADNRRYRLIYCGAHYYGEAYLYFTGMPMLTVNLTKSGSRVDRTDIGDKPSNMHFSYYDGCDAATGEITSAVCSGKIHIRGDTSRGYEKHSFRFSLYKDDTMTEQKNLSMCGLRKDDDWILNAMYQEETKVRDMLCYGIWEDLDGDHYGDGTVLGTRMRYVELIIGGKYWGLYGLCEPPDAKQFGMNEEHPGSICKISSWEVPSVKDIQNAIKRKSNTVARVELKYPDEVTVDGWKPFMDFLETAYEGSSNYFDKNIGKVMDVDNMLKFWVFLNVCSAEDSHFKNMCVVSRADDGKVLLVPWDCDISFGISWQQPTYLHLYHNPDRTFTGIYNQKSTERLVRRNPEDADAKLKALWGELRGSWLTEKELIRRARSYFAYINETGAMARNHQRWERSGYIDNLDYLEEYIHARLPYLDKYIKDLGK